MVLLIDNYDSFTYNLANAIQILDKTVQVVFNDKITLAKIQLLQPEAIVISPGPGTPQTAGLSLAIIKKFYPTIPILGICLGHQAIAAALGGNIIPANKPMHGKLSSIHHNGKTILKNVPNPFLATRYHSLIVDHTTLPTTIEVSAWTSTQEIMGIRVKDNPVPIEGLQFHPEAILTQHGQTMLRNFFELC